ncbi:MAG TPA: methylated-DNA--[protein]-cysteine S-methyltransferase [Candidatus Onthousia faecigallinarum]|nr:methylated-DNA--[protein]-cysteine S-methyltransferase [Candidatus Onthousia faecigallinarum]
MFYVTTYSSPLGILILLCNDQALLGVFQNGQKYFPETLISKAIFKEHHPILEQASNWLDRYFKGQKPNPLELPLEPQGTPFQKEVWHLLLEIPYGKVTTYQEIAKALAEKRKGKTMSCQAVGSAIGHNPLAIIIPCHRVIGKNGTLTGYALGIEKKKFLLTLEQEARNQTSRIKD